MSEPRLVEAVLDAWIVESGERPNLYVGTEVELSLGARVTAIDGLGKVPEGTSFTWRTAAQRRRLFATVDWVEKRKHHLRMVVHHEGAPLAVEPRFAQGPRRPSLAERMRGYRGLPTFVPVRLPTPVVGQRVQLECQVGVMAEYDVEDLWTGPDVSARYSVETVDAIVVTPQPLPEGSDEFDDHPQPQSRVITGLTSTRRPEGLTTLGHDQDNRFTGEDVSAYVLGLRPVDPLPRHRL
jgi:hypothetical protein